MTRDAIQIQATRYSAIAAHYEQMHDDEEHRIALAFLDGAVGHLAADSVLDVGAGTGRTMFALRQRRPDLRVAGIEPVEELRRVGHGKGIPPSDLIGGDGYALPFRDGEFDIVCEFAVLHHVREPARVVGEMLRVARRAVFISDSNNFGGGGRIVRTAKQVFHAVGLWGLVNYLKTGGKGYSVTEGDGLFYSFSVFDMLDLIRRQCRSVHMLNTSVSGPNLYRSASHVALLGVK